NARLEKAESDKKELQTRLTAALAMATLVPDLRKDLQTSRDKLREQTTLTAALDKEVNQRTKELANLNAALADLRNSKVTLENASSSWSICPAAWSWWTKKRRRRRSGPASARR